MQRALTVALVVGVLVLGVLGERRMHQLDQKLDRLAQLATEPRAPIVVATAAPPSACPSPPPSIAPPAPTVATPSEGRASSPSPETQVALDEAQHVLDAAIARGRFGRDDVQALRRELAGHSGPEAEALLAQLAVAINTGKLVPEDPTMRLLP